MIRQAQQHTEGRGVGLLARWRLAAQRLGIVRLQSFTAHFTRRARRPTHLLVGERGELEALFFLRRLGYVVVARRWRSAELRGDLDLVAWEGDALCFVEVKTRSVRDQTPAALAIDPAKRRMLARMARSYLNTLPRKDRSVVLTRMDIVSVYLPATGAECELIRDAFDWRSAGSAGMVSK